MILNGQLCSISIRCSLNGKTKAPKPDRIVLIAKKFQPWPWMTSKMTTVLERHQGNDIEPFLSPQVVELDQMMRWHNNQRILSADDWLNNMNQICWLFCWENFGQWNCRYLEKFLIKGQTQKFLADWIVDILEYFLIKWQTDISIQNCSDKFCAGLWWDKVAPCGRLETESIYENNAPERSNFTNQIWNEYWKWGGLGPQASCSGVLRSGYYTFCSTLSC